MSAASFQRNTNNYNQRIYQQNSLRLHQSHIDQNNSRRLFEGCQRSSREWSEKWQEENRKKSRGQVVVSSFYSQDYVYTYVPGANSMSEAEFAAVMTAIFKVSGIGQILFAFYHNRGSHLKDRISYGPGITLVNLALLCIAIVRERLDTSDHEKKQIPYFPTYDNKGNYVMYPKASPKKIRAIEGLGMTGLFGTPLFAIACLVKVLSRNKPRAPLNGRVSNTWEYVLANLSIASLTSLMCATIAHNQEIRK